MTVPYQISFKEGDQYMKNLILVIVTLIATSSVWAIDCSEANLKDCVQSNCESIGKGAWKDNQCIKVADAHASEKSSDCAVINSDKKVKDVPVDTKVKSQNAEAIKQ
jgi:hypothetical protein